MISINEFTFLSTMLHLKGQIDLRVNGNSMKPTMKELDNIRIVSCEEYLPGDVLVFLYENNAILVHRLLKVCDSYYCKGDNSFRLECIEKEQILGKVETINGKKPVKWSSELIECSYEISCLFKNCEYNIKKIVKDPIYKLYISQVRQL